MKTSYLFTLGIIGFFLLTSCSQSRDLTRSDGPQYRYNKVYVGNKIVYRGMQKTSPEPQHLQLSHLNKIEPLPTEQPIALEAPTEISHEKITTNTKAKAPSVVTSMRAVFLQKLSEVRHDLATGDIFNKETEFNAWAYRAEDRTMQSADEIFAILGFVFGLASLLNAIWFSAILGVVFSILGWNSEWNVFAVLGLVFSLAGVVLFLI